MKWRDACGDHQAAELGMGYAGNCPGLPGVLQERPREDRVGNACCGNHEFEHPSSGCGNRYMPEIL